MENKKSESFQDAKRLLDRKQYFDLLEGETISGNFRRNWKRKVNGGVEIPKSLKL